MEHSSTQTPDDDFNFTITTETVEMTEEKLRREASFKGQSLESLAMTLSGEECIQILADRGHTELHQNDSVVDLVREEFIEQNLGELRRWVADDSYVTNGSQD